MEAAKKKLPTVAEVRKALRVFFASRGVFLPDDCIVGPRKWEERGEAYAKGAFLVVLHDGGDHAGYFNFDYQQYENIDALTKMLQPYGLFAENATSWYSGIYPI